MRYLYLIAVGSLSIMLLALFCSKKQGSARFTGAKGEVKLMTLVPGHFHAALVQKTMYDQIDPEVHVFAPEGSDVTDHLKRIDSFNSRDENPTSWQEKVYTGPDYLEKMLKEQPGNVMVIAGKNKNKTSLIKATVDAGIHVLSDKPMCINSEGFEILKDAFTSAKANGALLYDIMTERYEMSTQLQKELAHNPSVFGAFIKGSPELPSVTKESVHHFFKYVSGSPLKRSAWYFDTDEQGEGIVDVTTHLVDLIQWACFPEQIIDYQNEITLLETKRWPTMITQKQFEKVTKLPDFTDALKSSVNQDGILPVYANGEITYRIRDIHAKVSVIWNFEAPEGSKDTHYSIMRGTKSNIIIRQGKEENYRTELYVEPAKGTNKKELKIALTQAVEQLNTTYPGLKLEKKGKLWHIVFPDKYRIGHEAHFAQVMEKYLRFLVDGKLPEWEVPNMIAKYYTTTKALELAKP